MSIGIDVGGEHFPIGTPAFFKSFFSTIYVRLEPSGWGVRFPHVMKHLYAGRVAADAVDATLKELDEVQEELSSLPPSDLVWDFENLSAQPPWGDRIAKHITSLGNYYITSDGKDLFDVLRRALRRGAQVRQPASIW